MVWKLKEVTCSLHLKELMLCLNWSMDVCFVWCLYIQEVHCASNHAVRTIQRLRLAVEGLALCYLTGSCTIEHNVTSQQ